MAKRQLWKAISAIKSERSVILTSHSMEECEALCDRIGIMVSGDLGCLGSIQSLKSRFGSGYHLQAKVDEEDADSFVEFLHNFKGLLSIEEVFGSNVKAYISQDIPLSELFEILEAEKQNLGIKFYSVSQCTLEQVFLSIARADVPENQNSSILQLNSPLLTELNAL